ncbi:META domain-containing protein [Phytohabitans sp. LJ34]|uniref:META domain-containing protein n=1 Tax=Phytohabitans sp. LJ34 TaxID=3452217 RepID=UPI003F8A8801
MRSPRLAGVFAAAFLCVACGDEPIVDPGLTLTDNRWEVRGVVAGGERSPAPGAGYLFFAGDGTLTGSTGCEEVSGRYTKDGVAGGRIHFTGAAPATSACAPDLVRVLAGDATFQVRDGNLELIGARGDGIWLRFGG